MKQVVVLISTTYRWVTQRLQRWQVVGTAFNLTGPRKPRPKALTAMSLCQLAGFHNLKTTSVIIYIRVEWNFRASQTNATSIQIVFNSEVSSMSQDRFEIRVTNLYIKKIERRDAGI